MNTINKKEIEKFSQIANEWWNPEGKFKPLHKFNPIRIKYIKDNIIKHFKLPLNEKPLKKIEILDIGCGGGLLSEPMCRMGANIVGIDASEENIRILNSELKNIRLEFEYLSSSEKLLEFQNLYFDDELEQKSIDEIKIINKSSNKLLIKELKIADE